jgi:hypothetical protein
MERLHLDFAEGSENEMRTCLMKVIQAVFEQTSYLLRCRWISFDSCASHARPREFSPWTKTSISDWTNSGSKTKEGHQDDKMGYVRYPLCSRSAVESRVETAMPEAIAQANCEGKANKGDDKW